MRKIETINLENTNKDMVDYLARLAYEVQANKDVIAELLERNKDNIAFLDSAIFKEYHKIMKEHGIGELLFLYNEKECSIGMEILDFSLNYSINIGEEFYYSDNFEEITSCRFLSIGKTLEEIWDEIEILTIDSVCEKDYDFQTCSYNFIERLKQIGEWQWRYSHTFKQSFLIYLKYVLSPIVSTFVPSQKPVPVSVIFGNNLA